MGVTFLNGKVLEPNEKATNDSEKNNEEFKEESDIEVTASELEMEFENMSKELPITLDVISGKRSSKSSLESCPCGKNLDLPSFATFINTNKNIGWYTTNSGDYTDFVSLNLFYKTLSLLSFPLNLRLSEFNSEDLICQRKTKSINGAGGLFSERSIIDGIRNVVPYHTGWWKLDSFQENYKAITLLKRSLFVQLGILDNVVNQPRSRSSSLMWKALESSSSTLLVGNTSLQKSKSELTPIGKESSEGKFPEMKLICCPSSNSTFSYQSSSSAYSSITKGQLQYLQKGETPYFIFSVDDAPQVMYIAIPQKIESSAEKAIDNMYFFYIKDSKNSDSRKHNMNPTSLIAKMKVSSSIVLKPNRVKIMETEFVLYGSQEEISNELQKSSSIVSRSKVFPKKITEIFRQSNMGKNKPKDKVDGKKLDGLIDINESSLLNDAFDGLIPNLELAAIVVEVCLQDTINDLMFGGWGMKFLDKASNKDTSLESSHPSFCSENPSNKDENARSMNVIIPADLHGGPVTRHGGPASIIDRWRSPGHCDCGGWDIGCPVRVLNYNSIYSNASPKGTEKAPFNLFIEGTKNSGHPTLSMMKMTEGLYSIYFQSSLSVLQSFSIAVAAIHSKNGDLLPKL